ncbi:hypothetical protein [Pseudonocardia sp. TRM90224]|uniref:hypothetical protein n=1 Tax=Pseudonocardia sp. TRM90224 TaxID=2812678 RepID=UPI001E4C9F9D|nr:hypothetical protein [Pseudonocardia sp. TRM90224]
MPATVADLTRALAAVRCRVWRLAIDVAEAEQSAREAAEQLRGPATVERPCTWRAALQAAACVVGGAGAVLGLLGLALIGFVTFLPGPFAVLPPAGALVLLGWAVRTEQAARIAARVRTTEDVVRATRALRSATAAARGARAELRAAERLVEQYRVRRDAVRAELRRGAEIGRPSPPRDSAGGTAVAA